MKEFFAHSTNEIKTLLYGIFIYLNISIEPVVVLTYLMLIDTILGSIKVLRINYTKFSFRELLIGFVSKFAFLLLPIGIALAGKGLHYDWRIVVEISIKILIVSEAISILSNMIAIKTKEEVADFDIITRFLKKLRNILITLGENLLKKK